MIEEMGIHAPENKKVYDARRKLRVAGFSVLATIRMQRMSQEWNNAKKISESLHRAKNELSMKRESHQRKSEGFAGRR